MKRIIFGLFLAALLFSGCIQLPTTTDSNITESGVIKEATEAVETVTGNLTEEKKCEPAYASALPESGKMGEKAKISVTATCAKGKSVSMYLSGEKIAEQAIASDETSEITFSVPLKSDGTAKIEVKIDGKVIGSGNIVVSPFGSDDTSGTKNNAFSVKEWIASGFEAKNDMTVKSIGVYMKRLYSNTLKNSYVIVELHSDDGNKPSGSILAATYIPIEKITMNERWVWFNLDESVNLAKGKYWLVFRVDQENPALVSDVANIHYVGEDTTKPADWNIKKMMLQWNDKEEKYLETSWEPLSYDRTYSILISTQEH